MTLPKKRSTTLMTEDADRQEMIEYARLEQGELRFVVTNAQLDYGIIDLLDAHELSETGITGLPDDKFLISIKWPTEKR